MPLEDSLDILEIRLHKSAQALDNLLWAVVEAQPRQGPGHTLVDQFESAATDAADHARQAVACLRRVRRAPHSRRGVIASATDLRQCTEHVGELTQCMLSGMGSMEKIAALERLASERKGPWASWVHGVKDALLSAQQAVGVCATGLPNCWQGLLGQMLPALSGPRVSATGARIILNGADAKVSNETATKAATGRSSDGRQADQSQK